MVIKDDRSGHILQHYQKLIYFLLIHIDLIIYEKTVSFNSDRACIFTFDFTLRYEKCNFCTE